MNPIETIVTLQQISNLYLVHQQFGKVIDAEMHEFYLSGALKGEALSGSLRVMPPWMQAKHSSRITKENS